MQVHILQFWVYTVHHNSELSTKLWEINSELWVNILLFLVYIWELWEKNLNCEIQTWTVRKEIARYKQNCYYLAILCLYLAILRYKLRFWEKSLNYEIQTQICEFIPSNSDLISLKKVNCKIKSHIYNYYYCFFYSVAEIRFYT